MGEAQAFMVALIKSELGEATTNHQLPTSERVGEAQAFMVTWMKSEPSEATPPPSPPPGQAEADMESTCTLDEGTGSLADEEAT